MKVKIQVLRANVTLPEYQTGQSAGMDLRAAIDTPITLQSMERKIVPTGLAIALPQGYEAQVRSRGSLSMKHGICLVNGVGTVDADYRGELFIPLINLGTEVYSIQPNERIAQLVIARHETVVWQITDELPASERGDGAFGSTGKE